MGAVAGLKDRFKQLQDLIMPIEYIDDVEEDIVEVPNSVKAKAVSAENQSLSNYSDELKVSNGGTVHVTQSSYTKGFEHQEKSRPQFTVHTTKKLELKVQIYAPGNFDQVTAIADDLKAGRACVVNYEKIEFDEQRRICDFVNGVCYVLDGCAKRISEQIVLYVPKGVDVSEAVSVAMPE